MTLPRSLRRTAFLAILVMLGCASALAGRVSVATAHNLDICDTGATALWVNRTSLGHSWPSGYWEIKKIETHDFSDIDYRY